MHEFDYEPSDVDSLLYYFINILTHKWSILSLGLKMPRILIVEFIMFLSCVYSWWIQEELDRSILLMVRENWKILLNSTFEAAIDSMEWAEAVLSQISGLELTFLCIRHPRPTMDVASLMSFNIVDDLLHCIFMLNPL